jgi:hypothetical protein
MAQILDRLGCWVVLEKEAVDLEETSIRRTQLPHVIIDCWIYERSVQLIELLDGNQYNGTKVPLYCGGIEWMCRRSARSSGQVGRDSVRLRALGMIGRQE